MKCIVKVNSIINRQNLIKYIILLGYNNVSTDLNDYYIVISSSNYATVSENNIDSWKQDKNVFDCGEDIELFKDKLNKNHKISIEECIKNKDLTLFLKTQKDIDKFIKARKSKIIGSCFYSKSLTFDIAFSCTYISCQNCPFYHNDNYLQYKPFNNIIKTNDNMNKDIIMNKDNIVNKDVPNNSTTVSLPIELITNIQITFIEPINLNYNLEQLKIK